LPRDFPAMKSGSSSTKVDTLFEDLTKGLGQENLKPLQGKSLKSHHVNAKNLKNFPKEFSEIS